MWITETVDLLNRRQCFKRPKNLFIITEIQTFPDSLKHISIFSQLIPERETEKTL